MSSRKNIEEEEDDDEIEDSEPEEEEEEDEEEDEEEEEEAGQRPKKKAKANPFIMAEAEEDDDDGEDDDEDGADEEAELPEADFVNDREGERSRTSAHRQIQKSLRDSTREELVEKASYFERVYGTEDDYADDGDEIRPRDFHSEGVTSAALQPTSRDPNLWLVRCRSEKKRDTSRQYALALMRKFIDKEKAGEPLEIMSVLTCDHISGYIYIEAHKKTQVEKAIENMDGLYKTSIKLVPTAEMIDVLSVKKKEPSKLQMNSWVRMKRGIYSGDLGQVVDIDLERSMATVKCVPRIDLSNLDDPMAGMPQKKGEKRKRVGPKPPAQLLTRILEEHKELKKFVTNDKRGFIDWKGDRYKDGFLYKSMNIAALAEDATPTLDELQVFQGQQVADGELGSNIQAVLSGMSAKKLEVSSSWFKKGESVEVIEGELRGLVGVVEGIEGNVVIVSSKENRKTLTSRFAPSELRKFFEEGNHVKVIQGKHEGESGLVVKIDANIITLISESTQKEIQVFSKDVQKADDRSTGITSLENYFLHDFVNIDGGTVGVVIRVERDSLKILDQLGNVRSLRPQEITPRKNAKNAVSLDRVRNNIKIGDAVTIMDGVNKGKGGKILHLNRNTAFVLSHDILENQGVVAISTNNIQLVGAGNRMDQGFRMPAPRQAANPQFKKDALVSKVVKVKSGPFKGYQGTVKSVNENIVLVELHSRPRPISLDRSMIVEVDTTVRQAPPIADGSRTPAYAGSQTPQYSGSRTPAYAGSQTPMYGTGSRTPAYEGGMTPGYEGGRTPAWDAGSRTPSAAYHTPSWSANDIGTPSSSFTPMTPGHHAATPGETPREHAETPATPFEGNPETPGYGTPYGQPYGAHPYSSLPHTPGHLPSTPGGFPQTPAYGTPRTPGTPGGNPQTPQHIPYDDWVCPGLEVYDVVKKRRGNVRKVDQRICTILFEGADSTTQVDVDSLEPIRPSKNDQIRVIRGDHKGEVGSLLNIEGMDGIVRTPEWKILSINTLCKYRPIEGQ